MVMLVYQRVIEQLSVPHKKRRFQDERNIVSATQNCWFSELNASIFTRGYVIFSIQILSFLIVKQLYIYSYHMLYLSHIYSYIYMYICTIKCHLFGLISLSCRAAGDSLDCQPSFWWCRWCRASQPSTVTSVIDLQIMANVERNFGGLNCGILELNPVTIPND